MPFRVRLRNGRVIETDTAEEALAVEAADETRFREAERVPSGPAIETAVNQPTSSVSTSGPPQGSTPPAVWERFAQLLEGSRHADQREVLDMLRGRPAGFFQRELMQGTGATSKSSLGGTIGAIRRKCKAVGLDADQVVLIVRGDPRKNLDTKYLPGPLLLRHWPMKGATAMTTK